MILEYYFNKLDYNNRPEFLNKYLKAPCLLRLKGISYLCGMDYASKDIYNFKEKITRYDHSVSVALLTWKCSKNKTATIAGLFHDVATPCFSHVIDYMNKDYEYQESTELYTEKILKTDKYLNQCLKEDNINIEDIINFKKYSIVDNNRPMLCADRLDGVILTGISWTKNINNDDINQIIDNIDIYKNENLKDEIGFKSLNTAKLVTNVSQSIDKYCHSNEDNYMMELLAKITKYSIDNNIIQYNDLFTYSEYDLFNLLKSQNIMELNNLIYQFENIKQNEIPNIVLHNVKIRALNPIVNGIRYEL